MTYCNQYHSIDEIRTAAHALKQDMVKIVPVIMGKDVDQREVEEPTTNPGYIVNGTGTKNPDDLSKEILKKVNIGKCRQLLLQEFVPLIVLLCCIGEASCRKCG